jgi:hypothetical protein
MNYITNINQAYRNNLSDVAYQRVSFTMSQMARLGELVEADVLLEGLPRMIETTQDLPHLNAYYLHVFESLK